MKNTYLSTPLHTLTTNSRLACAQVRKLCACIMGAGNPLAHILATPLAIGAGYMPFLRIYSLQTRMVIALGCSAYLHTSQLEHAKKFNRSGSCVSTRAVQLCVCHHTCLWENSFSVVIVFNTISRFFSFPMITFAYPSKWCRV